MTAFYNEIDPYAAQWLRNLIAAGHIAPGVVDERSIVDLDPAELGQYAQCHFFAGIGVWSHALRRAGWADDRPVWTGSCPCQPFSNAGKSLGHKDERHLWPTWERLIRKCRPVCIFGEQVASIDGLAWLDLVCTDLENQGYAVGAVDLCAAGVGAPHIRQRLWFVAHANGRDTSERGNGGSPWIQRGRQHGQQSPEGGIAIGNVANTSGRGCGEQWRSLESREVRHADGSDGIGRLADSIGPGLGIVGRGRCIGQGDAGPHADIDHDGRMGDTSGTGLPARERQEFPRARGGDEGRATQQPGGSFWSDCEWVNCRDGKARPVEPGTFPLAHGAPARVGRLRAYGNAINAEAARAFIEAAAEVMP